MNWRNFKSDPPYDSYEDEASGYETDATWAWFTYRYKHRAYLNGQQFLSHAACKFVQGEFTLEHHHNKSPYTHDHIEVVSWVDSEAVRVRLLKDALR